MVEFNLTGYFQPWKVTFGVRSTIYNISQPLPGPSGLGTQDGVAKSLGATYITRKGIFLCFVYFPTRVCGKPANLDTEIFATGDNDSTYSI
jgi:hypothetical protein